MESKRARIVVIDDDENFLHLTARILSRGGHDVLEFLDPIEGLMAARQADVDVVVSDVQMPHLTGLELLEQLRRGRSDVEVVLMTGGASVPAAVEAVQRGAFDYLGKPFDDTERLLSVVERAAERRHLRRRTAHLESMLDVKREFEDFVGESAKMTSVFQMVDAIAASPSTVLIHGESGTGKELVARAIHRRSPRARKPLICVNCAALSDTLLDSELFGHVKGAFTGANTSYRGLIVAANGGTLFLDEVGDMPLATQVRLLRVLQEGEVRPVGAAETTTVDVRVICATHVDLEKARAQGRFRDDLFYRLAVFVLTLPPLRDRPEDIPLLVSHFVQKHSPRMGKQIKEVDPEATKALLRWSWPGNVRELENAIERAVVLAKDGRITQADLPPFAGNHPVAEVAVDDPDALLNLPYTVARERIVGAFARRYLTGQLRRTQGNVRKGAEAAGMDRSNFRRLLKEHGVVARVDAEEEGA